MTTFGLGTASILYKLTVCQFLNATIRSLKNFNIQEARRDAVCGISVKDSKLIIVNSISNFLNIFSFILIATSVLRRLVEHGWMGPEWAAMDKVLGHLSELYIHILIRRLPILLKNAIQFIENADEQHLLQTYRKSRIKYFAS